MGPHTRGMTATSEHVDRDAMRRSEARRAVVRVRMSEAERDALARVAQARGTSITDVMHEALAPVLAAGAAVPPSDPVST